MSYVLFSILLLFLENFRRQILKLSVFLKRRCKKYSLYGVKFGTQNLRRWQYWDYNVYNTEANMYSVFDNNGESKIFKKISNGLNTETFKQIKE